LVVAIGVLRVGEHSDREQRFRAHDVDSRGGTDVVDAR
jgi:hypothetical protein